MYRIEKMASKLEANSIATIQIREHKDRKKDWKENEQNSNKQWHSIKQSNKHVFGILELNEERPGQKIYKRNTGCSKMGEKNWE